MTLFQIEQEKTSVTMENIKKQRFKILYKRERLIKPKIYYEIATKFEWS